MYKIKTTRHAFAIATLLSLSPQAYGMKPPVNVVTIEPGSPQECIDVMFVEAAQNGYYRRVEELLPLVDVNVKVGSDNSCALGQAIMHEHESVLSLLFKKRGLDLDSPINAEGVLPLAGATITKNLDIVKMLVFARADIEAVDNRGMHPLLLASEIGDVDIVKFFLQHVSEKVVVLKTKDLGVSALYMASQNGHDQVVELLVENLDGKDIDTHCDRENATPLWIASQKGHDKTVQILVRAGADVNWRRKEEATTPLWAASMHGHLNTVQFLLSAKAETNRADDKGFFPLHAAAKGGHLSVLEALLENAPSMIDAQSLDGHTPLHVASSHNKLNAVALLLANKADPTMRCADGNQALDHASGSAVRELLARELMLRKFLASSQGAHREMAFEHVIDVGSVAGPEDGSDGGDALEYKKDESEVTV